MNPHTQNNVFVKQPDLSASTLGENVKRLLDAGVPILNVFDNLASAADDGDVADIASANAYLVTWYRDGFSKSRG